MNRVLVASCIVVLLLGLGYAFSWGKYALMPTKEINTITILIKDGAYQPAQIRVAPGEAVRLRFVRGEVGACTDNVFFPAFNVVYSLSAFEATDILLPPMTRGEVLFQCRAGSYRGKLVVE